MLNLCLFCFAKYICSMDMEQNIFSIKIELCCNIKQVINLAENRSNHSLWGVLPEISLKTIGKLFYICNVQQLYSFVLRKN